jgi:YVTN family beta-propeller protein
MTRRIAVLAGLTLTAACAAGDLAVDSSREARHGAVLFIANKQENSLSRIALGTGQETTRVPSCGNPHELALSHDGAHVALGCYGGTGLEIFATADLARVKRIELGEGARPHGLVWHSNGSLIASAEGRGSVFVVTQPLSVTPGVTEIAAQTGGPHLLAVSADGRTVWGTAIRTGEVVRIDLARGQATHRKRLGGETEAIALSPDGSALWVGANAANKLYRLDPATLDVQAEIATGAMPIRVAVSPDGRHAVTSNLRDGSLSVIPTDTHRVIRTIPVSGSAEAGQVTITFSRDGRRIYAAETYGDTVAEIDFATGEVIRRLSAGRGGDGLAIAE